LLTVAVLGLFISNPSYATQSVGIPLGAITASTQSAPISVMLVAHGHVGGHGGGWHGVNALHGAGGLRRSGGWYGGRSYVNPYYGGDYYTYTVPNEGCVWDGYQYICGYDESYDDY
jgi:hypothetical protein